MNQHSPESDRANANSPTSCWHIGIRELAFLFLMMGLMVVVTIHIADTHDAKVRAELQILIEQTSKSLEADLAKKSKALEEDLVNLKAQVETYQQEIPILRGELTAQKEQSTRLANSQKNTSSQLTELIEGSRALNSWHVMEDVEGGKPGADVLCQKGELLMFLTQPDAKRRMLSLSAAGLRLQNDTRTLEISERGIIFYENRNGQRLGNIVWQTSFTAPAK